jgi:hypothetical protein
LNGNIFAENIGDGIAVFLLGKTTQSDDLSAARGPGRQAAANGTNKKYGNSLHDFVAHASSK